MELLSESGHEHAVELAALLADDGKPRESPRKCLGMGILQVGSGHQKLHS
jgi:hypothetical protein